MYGKLTEIRTDNAPAPVGPYSQAIEANGLIFCSGQIPLDPASGQLIGKTAGEQTVQIIANMKAVLISAGVSLDQIVKTTIFLTNLGDFAEVNAVYEKLLGGHRPARSTVEVSKLPKGAIVEIECIAVR